MRRPTNILATAVGLSALGDFLALVPLALHLEQTTGSGYAVAALFMALWSPSVLVAGPAGLLVDRHDPRRVLLVTSLVQVGLAVALAFVDGTAAVLALAALLGSANALSAPAEFALLPRVATEDEIAGANGRIETARYLGFTIGPVAGALLAASGGTRAALLADAATFAAIGVAAVLLRPRAAAPAPAVVKTEDVGRARDGFAFLRRDAVLRGVLPVALAALLIMTACATAEVFFAKDVLGVGDLGYGVMMSGWTLGMVLGATALPKRVPVAATATVALLAVALQGIGIALPALWPVFAFTVAAFVGGGAAHGLKNVLLRTLIHRRTPDHLHGRAFAAYNGLRNAAELSALSAGGLLTAVLGPQATMAIAGAVPALLVAAAFMRRRTVLTPQPIPA